MNTATASKLAAFSERLKALTSPALATTAKTPHKSNTTVRGSLVTPRNKTPDSRQATPRSTITGRGLYYLLFQYNHTWKKLLYFIKKTPPFYKKTPPFYKKLYCETMVTDHRPVRTIMHLATTYKALKIHLSACTL